MRSPTSGGSARRRGDAVRTGTGVAAALLAAVLVALTVSTELVHLIHAAPDAVLNGLTDTANLSDRTP